MSIVQFLRPSATKIIVLELIVILYLYAVISPIQSAGAIGTSLAAMCYTGFSECFDNPSDARQAYDNLNQTATEYLSELESEASSPLLYLLTLNTVNASNLGEPISANLLLLGIYWYFLSCVFVWLAGKARRKGGYRPSEYLFQNKI
jgi:hypothetical protein